MICLIVVITLSPVFSEEYALHTDSIIYSARYGRTKLTTSKIIAALEVVIGTYLLYLLLNLVLYGCTYGLQGWNVSIQSSLHYASSIYNLTFLQMFFISVILNILGCSLDNYYIVFKCSNEFSCYSAYYFLRHLLLASCV